MPKTISEKKRLQQELYLAVIKIARLEAYNQGLRAENEALHKRLFVSAATKKGKKNETIRSDTPRTNEKKNDSTGCCRQA